MTLHFVAKCIGTIRLRSVYIVIIVHPHLYINPPVGLHAQGRHPNQYNHALGSDLRRRCRAYQSIPHQVDTADQAPQTAGDLWYFPAGHAHSIQAKNTTSSPKGAEFLLIFDKGTFSEDATFSLTDWLAHIPKEVIAKNFQLDISDLDEIPDKELYMFKGCPQLSFS